jgi:tetrapyrrole methylase family protein/MazG family protein
METLRSEKGCPWDREQTRDSLKPFLLEETYEVLEAIETGEPSEIKEELGDLLLQVIFHAEIAKERKEFDIEDILLQLQEKLIRRHPHVFGDAMSKNSQEVLQKWEEIKRGEEKNKKRKSALDGVPKELPALMRAHQLQGRAARVGFDWKEQEPVWEKVCEELKELETAKSEGQKKRIEAELGDLFFALVNWARFMRIDPEEALRKTNQRFYDRFHFIEKEAKKEGKSLSSMTLSEMDSLWQEAKKAEKDIF